jgi:hypothetical protein
MHLVHLAGGCHIGQPGGDVKAIAGAIDLQAEDEPDVVPFGDFLCQFETQRG